MKAHSRTVFTAVDREREGVWASEYDSKGERERRKGEQERGYLIA